MAAVVFKAVDQSTIDSPTPGKVSMFVDSLNIVSIKLPDGTVIPIGGALSEMITEMIADLQTEIETLKSRVTALEQE